MNGLQRVANLFRNAPVDRSPVLPILHNGLATIFDTPANQFATEADAMASTIIRGYRHFGYDGVTLSLGVTAEAEALGTPYELVDGRAALATALLADPDRLDSLRTIDPVQGGRMPMFTNALTQVIDAIGNEAYVLPILRGPLLAASQLRGVEALLMDMIDQPDWVTELLAFTTDVVGRLGKALAKTGAPGLMLGEATCSPSFIAPDQYRQLVVPHHTRLIAELKAAGWNTVGLHICGDTMPILEDAIATGADLLDVDYQVPATQALHIAQGRIVLRGNLDPAGLLRFGTPHDVAAGTAELRKTVTDTRWIISSGCDIPPGTPIENLDAFIQAAIGANCDVSDSARTTPPHPKTCPPQTI